MTKDMVTIKTENEEFSLTRGQVNAVKQYLLEEESLHQTRKYVDEALQNFGEGLGIKPTEEEYKDMAHDFIFMRDPRESDNDILDRIVWAYYGLDY